MKPQQVNKSDQFKNVLKEYKQIGDLQANSTIYVAVDKIPQVLKGKWRLNVDVKKVIGWV